MLTLQFHVVIICLFLAEQLIFLALLICSLLLIYAVLSFAIVSSFFDLNDNLYCRGLWECYITVIREGLLDTLGNVITRRYIKLMFTDS